MKKQKQQNNGKTKRTETVRIQRTQRNFARKIPYLTQKNKNDARLIIHFHYNDQVVCVIDFEKCVRNRMMGRTWRFGLRVGLSCVKDSSWFITR